MYRDIQSAGFLHRSVIGREKWDGLLYLGTVPGNFLKVFDWDGDGLELKPGEISNVRLDEMGFIFQQMYMLKNLSIYDNILLPAY